MQPHFYIGLAIFFFTVSSIGVPAARCQDAAWIAGMGVSFLGVQLILPEFGFTWFYLVLLGFTNVDGGTSLWGFIRCDSIGPGDCGFRNAEGGIKNSWSVAAGGQSLGFIKCD